MNKKHVWLMVAMCMLPLVALGVIMLFNIPINGVVWVILVALCPLSHVAMMFLMPHDHDDQPAPASSTKATPTHDHVAH